ncbi:MAG: metal dependent phosphohydrolase [Ignavibacteria bacterium]|nr:metal dependent phosphohydrolase [Ignavibacteria bacterium]
MSIIDSILNDKDLVSLPNVAMHLLNMLKKEDIDVREISRIIQSDPALTMKLLRVANSPLYAQQKQVTSIHQAIMMMGFSRLTNIVLGISIFSRFWFGSKKGASELMERFWLHSSTTGTISKSIANKLRTNFKEREFIGGLLHKIGKLAMIQYDVNKYLKVAMAVQKFNVSDILAEKKIFGVSHVEVGERLAQSWKLPEELVTIITSYIKPETLESNKELPALIGVSSLLAEIYGASFFKGLPPGYDIESDNAWKVLSASFSTLTENGLDFLTDDMEDNMVKSQGFLDAMKA